VSTLSTFCLRVGSSSLRQSTCPQGDFPTTASDELTMPVHWRERYWVHLREVMRDEESVVQGPLEACGLLKCFECSLVWAQEYLPQFLISMWSPNLQCFIVQGEHLAFIVIEDVYFLTGLPFRGTQLPTKLVLLGDG
jgi:hypothetical protein